MNAMRNMTISKGISRHAIFFITCCSRVTDVDMFAPKVHARCRGWRFAERSVKRKQAN
jgi:hypothetical protein